MKYCNIETKQKASKLPRISNTLNSNWNNAKQHYMNQGWRICIEVEPAEGYFLIPNKKNDYVQDPDNSEQGLEIIFVENDEERQERLAQKEQDRINNKSIELKEAENNFLSLVHFVNETFNIEIAINDGFQGILTKIDNSDVEKIDKLGLGMKLRTLWDVVLFHDGKWGDVQFHDLSL